MRIGVDVLAIQSPYSAGRGIGRYARDLLSHLLALGGDHDFVLYAYEDMDRSRVPTSDRSTFRTLARDPSRHEHNFQFVADRLARENPDRLDWLLTLSPFETWQFYGLPARPLNGLKMASVLYDLIPFLFQETYLKTPNVSSWFYGHLQHLRTHDLLLAISEASRRDALELLALPKSRVATVGTASDPSFFTPGKSGDDARTLDDMGIRGPFLFCLGSGDPRKNLDGLFRAFSLLPGDLRDSRELVVSCALTGEERERTTAAALKHGVEDRLRLTGEIDDRALRALYRGCEAFVFPSTYEGFGLPILEAMHCGAAVVAGNNSSQPEVVGDAGLLANASDPADLARAMERLLRDRSFAEELGSRAVLRAGMFQWRDVARRVLDAITGHDAHARPRTASIRPRPHLACLTPLPPQRSGIADYAARLVDGLESHYRVELYHDQVAVPDLDLSARDVACRPAGLFPRYRQLGIYGPRVIYQMGNSHYHHFMYRHMMDHPGVVVLHDFCLAGFHHGYEVSDPSRAGHLAAEIRHSHPDRVAEFDESQVAWDREPGGLPEALARRRFDVNRRVLERATAVVVHSDWARQQIAEHAPDLLARVHVVPMGAEPRPVTEAERRRAKMAMGLEPDHVVMLSLGILHPVKMNAETIEAFARIAPWAPRAVLVFAGRDLGDGEAASAVLRHGLSDRVRFLGHCSPAEYDRAIRAADLGICLRRPPTKGETSASLLDLLRHGRTAIVCSVGSFAEWPVDAVRAIDWNGASDDLDGLTRAMGSLLANDAERASRGARALAHVTAHHGWPGVARRYRDLLESMAA